MKLKSIGMRILHSFICPPTTILENHFEASNHPHGLNFEIVGNTGNEISLKLSVIASKLKVRTFIHFQSQKFAPENTHCSI